MKFTRIALTALLLSAGVVQAHDEDEKSEGKVSSALATAMKEATVTLASGLSASEAQGKPISGKFELEDGNLQLSIYTTKDGKFYEVIIDHKTGKVAKTEPITGGEDLTAAQHQSAALAKTTHSLRGAVSMAEQANPGFKAISADAEIEDGAVHADLTLLKGTQSKHVEQKF